MSAPLAVVLDGELIPHDQPAFSPLERALLYGDGLFETIAVAHGRALDAASHRARLTASCLALGFPPPPPWEAPILRCLEAAGPEAGLVRVTWTRGVSAARGYAPGPKDGPPRMLVLAHPAPPPREGVRAVSMPAPALGELARHKTTSALGRVVALDRARARGAKEAILLDADGMVLEASSSNVFAVIGGRLLTPPSSRPLLAGTARARTLAWTGAVEADFTLAELLRADEAFVTNAVIGANALVELDGIAIAEGPVGRDVIARDRAWRAAQS